MATIGPVLTLPKDKDAYTEEQVELAWSLACYLYRACPDRGMKPQLVLLEPPYNAPGP